MGNMRFEGGPRLTAAEHAALNVTRLAGQWIEVIQPATDLLTAAECSNTLISNFGQSAANTQTLPAAAAGLNFRVIIATTGMGAFHVKPGTGDLIYLDGSVLHDGDKVSLAAPAIGDCADFWCFQTGATAYDWYCNTLSGAWADGGA